MRSYTNRKGDSTEVSQEHLDMAIRIKEELQKLSPSRKCNWKQHKEMMEIEGFVDSDTNESYRCMIKAYQKSVGKLPEAPKYADMVSEGKLQSIKEIVGEMAYEKRENQHVLRQLNKVKRDVIDFTLIAEQIGESFKRYDWSKINFTYNPIQKTNKKMVVFLSDLHIGALVDIDENKYNFAIAEERMQKYLDKVIAEIEMNGIEEVYLMNLGDTIENPYMHNLSYTSEFTFSEQIAYASDIIIKFIKKLSEVVYVRVAGIAGNHDRMNEDKNKALYGDHAIKGINKAIQSFIEHSEIERVTYEQAKDYEHSIEVNGLDIKCVHGDLDGIGDKNVLGRHSLKDGKNYSLIVMGHYHHHWIKEVAINKFMVGFGSLKGADAHGDRTRLMSSASQGFILVDENGDFEIRSVKLSA
jgi:predicted MPP superfamily phosphohydrolase